MLAAPLLAAQPLTGPPLATSCHPARRSAPTPAARHRALTAGHPPPPRDTRRPLDAHPSTAATRHPIPARARRPAPTSADQRWARRSTPTSTARRCARRSAPTSTDRRCAHHCHTALTADHSAPTPRQQLLATRHSVLGARSSPLSAQCSALGTRHSALGTEIHRSALRSPLAHGTRRPPLALTLDSSYSPPCTLLGARCSAPTSPIGVALAAATRHSPPTAHVHRPTPAIHHPALAAALGDTRPSAPRPSAQSIRHGRPHTPALGTGVRNRHQ